jgi:hypothetical protein
MIFVSNLVPIAGNRIVGLVDLIVPPDDCWNLVFRRCPWICDERGERVELLFGVPFEFSSPLEGPKFQKLALNGARALIDQKLAQRGRAAHARYVGR